MPWPADGYILEGCFPGMSLNTAKRESLAASGCTDYLANLAAETVAIKAPGRPLAASFERH